ncbi:MAG: septum site-determining protein MinC [Lachnospiraceae bacterium]|nr:septum site-determining protein MinC [Lachnospiraceae bacterium]
MSQPVTLKGVKSGLIVKLTDQGNFADLVPEIKKKFKEGAAFFGTKHMILSIEGRDVNEEETAEILKLLTENTKLQVDTVMVKDKVLENKFQEILGEDPGHEIENARLRKDNDLLLKTVHQLEAAVNPMNAEIHAGNLRSGRDIDALGSVIILGDVKPGATVTAGGSIFVMGAMQGTADAGAYGDSDAFVMALRMDPLQIRISDAMAIAQDNVPKRKRGFMRPKDEIIPEVALISDGHIVIRDYDSEFVRNCRFFRTDKKAVSVIEEEAPKPGRAKEQGALSDKEKDGKKPAGNSKSVEV